MENVFNIKTSYIDHDISIFFLNEYRNVSPHFLVAIHSSSIHSILK